MAKTGTKKPVKKAVAKPTANTCCCTYPKHHAPFAFIIFVIAILWILQEFSILAWNVPWLPIVIGLVALGTLANPRK